MSEKQSRSAQCQDDAASHSWAYLQPLPSGSSEAPLSDLTLAAHLACMNRFEAVSERSETLRDKDNFFLVKRR